MLYENLQTIQSTIQSMTAFNNKPVTIGFKNTLSAGNMPHAIIQIEDGDGKVYNLNVNRVHVMAFYYDETDLQESILGGMEDMIIKLRDNCPFLSKDFSWIISPTLPLILGFEQKLLPPFGGFDLIYEMNGRYES